MHVNKLMPNFLKFAWCFSLQILLLQQLPVCGSDLVVVCCVSFQGQLYPWQLLHGCVWICARNSVENTGMFPLLVNSACTAKLFSAALSVRTPGGEGRRHSQNSWPQLTKRTFHAIWCHDQHIKLKDHEGRTLEASLLVFSHYTFQGMDKCLPASESGELISYFALLVYVCFPLCIKPS